MERYGILNDIHFPWEDRQRYKLALQIFKDVGISRLYLNGDIAEFQGVSRWPTHPEEKTNFCQELEYVNKKFDELMVMFPDIPVGYLCGNHEDRFFRYVRDLAPAMWGVIDCPLLLKFPERPLWKFVPYSPIQLLRCGNSSLYLRHEPLGRGTNHARATAETSYVDIAYGHTHTWASYTHNKFGPTPYMTRAYSLGWLGDKTRPVFDYRGAKDLWIKGCSLVECDPKTGSYTLDFINLETMPVYYRGQSYRLNRR